MSQKNNIALIGLMGSGKTSVSKVISKQLNFVFVDIDEIIEKQEGQKISDIFKTKGEGYFRNLEVRTIKYFSKLNNQIISTGGGAVENMLNIKNLQANSLIFYLYAPSEVLYERLLNEIAKRPLLHKDNPQLILSNLLRTREPFYMLADYKIDTKNKNINQTAEEIIKTYSNVQNQNRIPSDLKEFDT